MRNRQGRPTNRSSDIAADAVLMAYGDACATLMPRIKEALGEVASGSVVEVCSDDPSARVGVPAWSRLTGHALIDVLEEDERRTRFRLRKK